MVSVGPSRKKMLMIKYKIKSNFISQDVQHIRDEILEYPNQCALG